MWDQSDFSLVPWFQQQTLLWTFVPFCNENFCFRIWSSTLFLSENWTRHSLESFTTAHLAGCQLVDESPSWPATVLFLLSSQQRMRDQGCSLCPCGALINEGISHILLVLNSRCVISLPLFTGMSADWLLCVFQCSNPSCFWSPPSQCSVVLQFVLLLTMFIKYVN